MTRNRWTVPDIDSWRRMFWSYIWSCHGHTYLGCSWFVHELHKVTIIVSSAIELSSILDKLPEEARFLNGVTLTYDNYFRGYLRKIALTKSL
jgi:hypothetical protein